MSNLAYCCPVCGYTGLDEPAYYDNGARSGFSLHPNRRQWLAAEFAADSGVLDIGQAAFGADFDGDAWFATGLEIPDSIFFVYTEDLDLLAGGMSGLLQPS